MTTSHRSHTSSVIDNSGLINFAEFSGLWKYIEEWRTCFSAFDQDKSGSIDFNELKTAMRSFRYNLSDDFLRLIIKKYDKRGKENSPVHNPQGFIVCCCLTAVKMS